eukprot:TRINITY_DN2310_c0_g1_i1.p1 TRINITY_DN2310_c0_g1~~TRINITY_DN2310_c0_g1_i1.p1  ORF type:complete len:819 (-),score=310.87 TRINITY_DN2310_c0_g1_i1:34-2490(-)
MNSLDSNFNTNNSNNNNSGSNRGRKPLQRSPAGSTSLETPKTEANELKKSSELEEEEEEDFSLNIRSNTLRPRKSSPSPSYDERAEKKSEEEENSGNKKGKKLRSHSNPVQTMEFEVNNIESLLDLEDDEGRIDQIEGFVIICDDQPVDRVYNEQLRRSGERMIQRRSSATVNKDSKYKEVDSGDEDEDRSSAPQSGTWSKDSGDNVVIIQKIINALRYFGGKAAPNQLIEYIHLNLNNEKTHQKTLQYRINSLLGMKKYEDIFIKSINGLKVLWSLNESEDFHSKNNSSESKEEKELDIEGYSSSNDTEDEKEKLLAKGGQNNGIKKIATPYGIVMDQTELLPYQNLMGCRVCRSTGEANRILLCDGCDDEYHMSCLVPSLLYIPRGQWFCPRCVNNRDEKKPKQEKEKTPRASKAPFINETSVFESLTELGGKASGVQIRDFMAKKFDAEDEDKKFLLNKIYSVLSSRPEEFQKGETVLENQKRTTLWKLAKAFPLSDYLGNDKPEEVKQEVKVETKPKKEPMIPIKKFTGFEIPTLTSVLDDPHFPIDLPYKVEEVPKIEYPKLTTEEIVKKLMGTWTIDVNLTDDLLKVVLSSLLTLNNNATAEHVEETVRKLLAEYKANYDPDVSLKKRVTALLSSRFHHDLFEKIPGPLDDKGYCSWRVKEEVTNGKRIHEIMETRSIMKDKDVSPKKKAKEESEPKKEKETKVKEEKIKDPDPDPVPKESTQTAAPAPVKPEASAEKTPTNWMKLITEALKSSSGPVGASELPVKVAEMVTETLKNVKYHVANTLQKNPNVFEKTTTDNKSFWALRNAIES